MLTTFHSFGAYANLYELNRFLVSRAVDILGLKNSIPFSQAVTLEALLETRGVDVGLLAVPDEPREHPAHAHELERSARTANFLSARLGAR